MTTQVGFSTPAGGHIDGALAEPPGTGKLGAVVVVHEWHGLNEVMKLHCEQFAGAGFVALAPDLFHGKLAANDDEAAKLWERYLPASRVLRFGETLRHLSALERDAARLCGIGVEIGRSEQRIELRKLP